MAMKTLKSLVLLSAAVAALSGAASAQIGKGDKPVQITSKEGEYLQKEGKGVFTGDVVAVQSDAKITTDKLTVYCSRSTPASGKAAECEAMEQLIAEGNVLYVAPDVKIRGDRAVYDYAADTITITGQVTMSRGVDGAVQGTKMVYNVGQGRTQITADDKKVTMVFTPAKSEDQSGAKPATPPPATPPATPPG